MRRFTIQKSKSLILLLVFFAIGNLASFGQEGNSVSILANLTTNDLKRLGNIGPKNIRATLDHIPINVTAVRSEGPRRIILLLDASRSVAKSQRDWNIVILAARDFVSDVPKDCSLGLIVFAGSSILEVELSKDRQKITETLNDVAQYFTNKKPRWATALYDSLQHAIDLLGPAELGDAIYVATDGIDNCSKIKRLKESLQQKQIRLFLFLLDNGLILGSPVSFLNTIDALPAGRVPITQLSIDTLGHYYVMHNLEYDGLDSDSYQLHPNETATTFSLKLKKLHDLVFKFYRLDLAIPEVKKTSKLNLELLDQNGQLIKDVRIFYSTKLYPNERKADAPKSPL